LRDKKVLERIIGSADLKPDELVVEVGPGEGVLTRELVRKIEKVIAIEIDRNLAENLKKNFAGNKKIEIINNDILIMAAAVADFKPSETSNGKIKKEDKIKDIKLSMTDDILLSLKDSGKKIIGFALETDNEEKNALNKLKCKNLDMIVLNSLRDQKSGFEFNTNKIKIIHRNGEQIDFPLQSKYQAANKILSELMK